MSIRNEPIGFEILDEAHRQVHAHLNELADLIRRVEASGFDQPSRVSAGKIEAFFSGTSRQHHAEEERSVFPPLLASGDDTLVSAVRTLQQDHGWIEENWIELAPQLSAVASGNGWLDPVEFQHYAQVFLDLCTAHIELEESLIYPAAKVRRAAAAEAHRARISRSLKPA